MKIVPISVMLWGVATLMVGGIVHIASILMLPALAPDDAFARLSRTTRLNAVTPLPSPASGRDMLPFRDPALASAVCRYDLSTGALRVGAAVGDAAFMAVSFHTSTGVAFYALTDRSQNAGRIDVLLLTKAQKEEIDGAAAEDDPEPEIRVTAPDDRGFVEFDALPRVGGEAAARRLIESARCQLEHGR